MVKKIVSSSLEFIQEHRNAFLLGTIIPALFGLFLAEAVISVMFHALQPILVGMTLITVETLGAILVDFPLSVVAGIIIAKKIDTTESKYGVLTGAIFLSAFIVIVLCMGLLHNVTTFFDVFGLGNAVILAVQTAWKQFGFHLGVMMFMFLVFDYFLCMLGSMLGFKIVQLSS
jgi:hypothetical protein